MSAIPPKHTPESPHEDENDSNMLSMYQAGQSDTASFPVLQAFQKYIDQERAQARKRITLLSITFSSLLVFLLTLFIVIGLFLFNKADNSQTKLLDALLARQQPTTVGKPGQQPSSEVSPELAASLQQMAKVTDAIQKSLKKQQEDSAKLSKENENLKKHNAEMEKLRNELKRIQEESANLKKSMKAIKEGASKKQARHSWMESPIHAYSAPKAKKDDTPKAPAVVAVPKAVPPPPPKVNPFPPATKAPPEVTPGVKPPKPLKGMMSTKIPISTKKVGNIPWRVMIPE